MNVETFSTNRQIMKDLNAVSVHKLLLEAIQYTCSVKKYNAVCFLPGLQFSWAGRYLPAYENGTECSETLAYKIQTPGNYPEKSYATFRTRGKFEIKYSDIDKGLTRDTAEHDGILLFQMPSLNTITLRYRRYID
jgi:hypothetical protein